MSKDKCLEIQERLAAFLDDELPADASHDIQEHLESCKPCAELTRVEQAFTKAMRARIGRLQAPGSIMDRVREQLEEESGAPESATEKPEQPGWFKLRYRRAGYGLAVAAAVTLLIVPFADRFVPTFLHEPASSSVSLERIAGVLVCLECDRSGLPLDRQRNCTEQAHQTGLRCPDTGLWHLVANEASLTLLSNPGMRGRQVILGARRLHDIKYLDVQTVSNPSGT